MGCYVNPPSETKESFLEREGKRVEPINALSWEDVPEGMLPVVLINNGPFTAAGVAYKRSELVEFTDPRDYRPKKVYLVPIDKLSEVSDIDIYL